MEKYLFSPLQLKVLKILGSRRMQITDITAKVYKHKRKPKGANIRIATAVDRINQKCDVHGLDWFLHGVGGGRQGKLVWKDHNL